MKRNGAFGKGSPKVLRYPRMLALDGLSEKRIYDYVGFPREVAEIVVPNPLRLCGGLVCAISSRPRFRDHECRYQRAGSTAIMRFRYAILRIMNDGDYGKHRRVC
jgi:hypothetical protein